MSSECNVSILRKAVNLLIVVLLVILIILWAFLPLLISQAWDWWQAWIYAIAYLVSFVISRWLAARRHPGILAERVRFMRYENTVSWDKRLAPLVGFGSALIPLVAGLERCYGWTAGFSLWGNLLGLLILLAGYTLASWALIENRYFSGQFRIQSERGHQVVSSGPYGWMRHPGYSGALLVYLATPLLLGSPWSFVPALLISSLLVMRTALEDRFLQAELTGYREYAGQVRFRLLPGVW